MPEEYAERTIAPPPVATTTSTSFINSRVVSTEPSVIICTRSSGPPPALTTRAKASVRCAVHCSAFGCGAKITALPALSANIALHIGVTIGLVTGVTAPTTPIALATRIMLASAFSAMMPRDFLPLRLFQMVRALPLFLMILSS